MKKPSLEAKGRNDKREIYTWIKKDKYEELMNIAEKHGVPIATLARVAILEMIKKLNKKERIVT